MDEPDALLVKLGGRVEELLTEHGAMSEDEIFDALIESATVDDATLDDALSEVLDDYLTLAMPLPGGRWVWLPALLAGRVFTHEVSKLEFEYDLLDLVPDLAPVAVFAESDDGGTRALADGSACAVVVPGLDDELLDERGIPVDAVFGSGGLLLAPGSLRGLGLSPGDLVGVRVTPSGLALEAAGTADLPMPDGLAAGLIAACRGADHDTDVQPQPLDLAVWSACADDPALFAEPAAPIGRAVATLGLALDGEFVAPPDFDIAGWQLTGRVDGIAARHDLDPDEALAVLVGVNVFGQVARVYEAALELGDDPQARATLLEAVTPTAAPAALVTAAGKQKSTVRDVLALLDSPAVAEALLTEIGPSDPVTWAAFGLFAETLEPMVPRSARVAVRWLRGRAYDRLGDVAAAGATFRAAETLDPEWGPVLVELARIASDHGDAERGLALLRRAGLPDDDDLVTLLLRFRPAPRRALGRNAPCWCGSGRKYKQCHLHNEQLPLDDRAAWLYQKAGMTLLEHHRAAVLEVALARAEFDESPTALLTALNDPLVGDAVLFEGGAFAEFLARRGFLLPADELVLGQQWLMVSRSVHEVEAVRSGQGMRLRDLRTGDVHEVRERTASRSLRPGTLVCARVVPVDDTMQVFGGIEPVSLGERDDLLALLDAEPEPADLVGFLSRRFAPVRLQNTESEPMVLCEATVHIDSPDGFAQALTTEFGAPEYQNPDADLTPRRWHETVVTHGMTRIRATFTLDGYELTVEANSATRQDRALDTVRRFTADAVVITDLRRPVRDADEFAAMQADFPSRDDVDVLDPSDPEVAAYMGQVMRQLETAWLDDAIPALGGRTPRECAADPTRRRDVVALLDSFGTHPGGMDVDRLRAALGLT